VLTQPPDVLTQPPNARTQPPDVFLQSRDVRAASRNAPTATPVTFSTSSETILSPTEGSDVSREMRLS
jgi:hypothetical protein